MEAEKSRCIRGQIHAVHPVSRYDTHKNDPGDAGYIKFLRKATDPFLAQLSALNIPVSSLKGIDFGCGPVGFIVTQPPRDKHID